MDAPATDHDGNPRPYGNGYDIGAYEYQGGNTAVVVDYASPGYSETGLWTTAAGGGYGGSSRTAPVGQGEDTVSYEVNNLAAGSYSPQVTWQPDSTRATNATYYIYDGLTLVGTVVINQQNPPSGSTVSGMAVQTLGTFTIKSGILRVVLSNSGNGTIDADAMRLP